MTTDVGIDVEKGKQLCTAVQCELVYKPVQPLWKSPLEVPQKADLPSALTIPLVGITIPPKGPSVLL